MDSACTEPGNDDFRGLPIKGLARVRIVRSGSSPDHHISRFREPLPCLQIGEVRMPLPEHPGNEEGWNRGGRQCTGWVRDENRRCQNVARQGLNVCKFHGATTKAIAIGKQRVAEHEAEQRAVALLEKRGVPTLGDPLEELERAIAETVALKDLAGQKVAELAEWRYTSAQGTEQLRGELAYYERLLARTTKDLIEYQKLGLQERRVQLSALQIQRAGQAWNAATNEVLDKLEAGESLTDIRQQLPEIARRHLTGT